MLLQISFLGIAYPVLIVTYLGQAAWLTAHPDQVSSTFYASIPYGNGFYWVRATPFLAVLVVSVLLTVRPSLCNLLLLCSNLFCNDFQLSNAKRHALCGFAKKRSISCC